jgi:hypothetical protein
MSSRRLEAALSGVSLVLVGAHSAVDLIGDAPTERSDRFGLGVASADAALNIG